MTTPPSTLAHEPSPAAAPHPPAAPATGRPTDATWHARAAAEVLAALATTPERGLDERAVAERRARHGRNALTPHAGPGPLRRFLLQFHQPLVYILLGAAALTAWLEAPVDASAIAGVVLLNAIVGYVQEARALAAIGALANTLTSSALVVRGGARHRVDAVELVPGDVVLLEAGDRVPADLRLLAARELAVDESALTGESLPVEKAVRTPEGDVVLPADTPLADRRNLAYASTLVTRGNATGVVVATGDATEIGRVADLLARAAPLATPLTRRIERFSRVLLIVILALAAALFVVGTLRGEPLLDTMLAAVALAVAAIPEGLPAAVTITLAIGVSRMARRRAVIRRLPAVEALGGTTVICSDKTGTLTENAMTVQRVTAGDAWFAVSGLGYAPDGAIARAGDRAPDATPDGAGAVPAVAPDDAPDDAPDAASNAALHACLAGGALCNDAAVREEEGRWRLTGDPTEGALLVAARKAGFDPDALERRWPRVDAVPFSSERRFMATLHARAAETDTEGAATADPDAIAAGLTGDAAGRVLLAKGAIEAILPRCTAVLEADGRARSLDDAGRARLDAAADRMAADGLRVLAVARGAAPADDDALDERHAADLTLLGLEGMLDPPRAAAQAAVAACHAAGVRVKMITGDHAATARAVATTLGLGGPLGVAARRSPPNGADAGDGPAVLTGRELAALPDAELPDAIERTTVFARVAPEQKLRIVEALQARGHVVAMTGDGVNDAPALRRADIGVAMGVAGTEVAREAADMVLTDDDFASIAAAVEEGRGVFDNLVKFLTWTLPTNIGEGLVILVAVALGIALPILPVQILWINMTTAVFLGLTLAFEPKEPDLMRRLPRRPDAPLVERALVLRMLLVGLLLVAGAFFVFWGETRQGAALPVARTAATNVFVVGQIFFLLNCRSLARAHWSLGVLRNRWLVGGVALMVLLQLAFTYLGPMQRLFHSAALDAAAWARVLAVALVIHGVVGAEKALRNRIGRPAAAP